jgi:hypothetical protein
MGKKENVKRKGIKCAVEYTIHTTEEGRQRMNA